MNVIIAVVDMMMVGAAGGVAGKTVGLYLITTLIAGTFGAVFAFVFSSWFAVSGEVELNDDNIYITLGCNETDSYLTQSADGSVSCSANWTTENDITWIFGDPNGSFQMKDAAFQDVSLSKTIYDGIFMKLVTDK